MINIHKPKKAVLLRTVVLTMISAIATHILLRPAAAVVTAEARAAGATITLNALESGFYMQNGTHVADNYAAGWYTNSIPNNVELRNYFVFDLSPVSGHIDSAVLRLSTAPEGFIRYGSTDPSEIYTLFDVATALATLTGGTGGIAAFADLADGTSYGSVVATSALGSTVDVPLNAAGVAFLAANTGEIAIGGALTTLAKGGSSEFLFNATSASLTRQLVITTDTAATPISIDIKPGSYPNTINLGSGGTVAVAILSSPAFDAATVSPTTLTLAGAAVQLRGKGTPMASMQDVDGDGILDLVVHVSTEALALSSGDTVAILTGQTYAGEPVEGSDTVRIVQ